MKMNSVQAINKFFGDNKKVTMEELKQLSQEERVELGQLCCKALEVEFEPPKASSQA